MSVNRFVMFLHHAIAVNFDFMLIAITTLSPCLEPFKQEWQMLVQFSHSVVSDSLWPHGLQHTKLPCPSPTSRACSNLCPSSQWCHPTISSSVVPFSCLQSFPASGSFPMSQFFPSGGHSIGASVSGSVLPMNIQYWFPLGWTDFIFLISFRIGGI